MGQLKAFALELGHEMCLRALPRGLAPAQPPLSRCSHAGAEVGGRVHLQGALRNALVAVVAVAVRRDGLRGRGWEGCTCMPWGVG